MSLSRVLFAVLACWLWAVPEASAYPQFQFTTGTTDCGTCHISPSGGGLINDWGREESADVISLIDGESTFGNPQPLNGLWDPPSWFRYGADFRSAAIVKTADNEDARVLAFPMQGDIYTSFKFWKISVNLTVGVRGSARPEDAAPFTQRFVSDEHYVMWQQYDSYGYYLRAGRFFAPYGLRLHDHTANVRRRMGFNLLQEPYAVSGGWSDGKSELHVSAWMPSRLFQAGAPTYGGAAYYERRVGSANQAAIGAQAKIDFGEASDRYFAGLVGKYFWDKADLLFLGELNVGTETFAASSPRLLQLAGYVGVTYVPENWLMFGSSYERYDNDVLLTGSSRDSVNFTVQFFPVSHFELMWMSKLDVQGGQYGSQLHMLMFHYYL